MNKYLTFSEWISIKYKGKITEPQFNAYPFELQLGIVLSYFQDFGIVIAAFNTGYLVIDINSSIRYPIEADGLEAQRIEVYYKLAFTKAFELMKTKIKKQNEPF